MAARIVRQELVFPELGSEKKLHAVVLNTNLPIVPGMLSVLYFFRTSPKGSSIPYEQMPQPF